MVTDGLVRDVRQMNEMGFGCFSRGYSPLDSAGRCYPKELNVTVDCGGVQVRPGDFILADCEGIVVISDGMRDEVFRLATEKLVGENTVRDELAAGVSAREVSTSTEFYAISILRLDTQSLIGYLKYKKNKQ